MTAPPSPPLTYLPAYCGLFAALTLAAACNAFLHIQRGTFGAEVLFWAAVFALTLALGWRQQGRIGDSGRRGQKLAFVIGAIVAVFFFIPRWGFGVAVLAVLQAGQNCITVSSRHLYMGLLVSATLVMFATWHHRADWTMLFYLLPYVAAAVFTLVAEQMGRRGRDLRTESLRTGSTGGQLTSMAAATAIILMSAGLLYALTPQVTWLDLDSVFGQPSHFSAYRFGPGGGREPWESGDRQGRGAGRPGDGQADARPPEGRRWGDGGDQGELADGDAARTNGLPSIREMREAAKRPGMPQWQSSTMEGMADLAEAGGTLLAPVKSRLDELWNALKKWLKEHLKAIALSLLASIVLALLIAAWRLFKEARVGVWLHARLDYLRLGLLGWHAQGKRGAFQYYAAVQRLLDLQGLPRPRTANAQEYLARICRRYDLLRREATEITRLFERARYGNGMVAASDLTLMRKNYRSMYRRVDSIE